MAVGFTYRLEERQHREQAITLFVQISSYERRIACGYLRSLLPGHYVSFYGLDQMLLLMEEMLDQENIWMDAQEYRWLGTGARDFWLGDDGIVHQTERQKKSVQPVRKFVIKIYGRQNRSLQGELRMAGRMVYFRSGMELLRLMHQALCMSVSQNESKRWK